MGEDVDSRSFTRQDRQQYRAKVRRCLDVFARMLAEAKFDFDRPLTGLEIEFNLIDAEQDPAMRNAEVLAAIANEDFQTELGQFNIEINVRPRSLVGQRGDGTRSGVASEPQRCRGALTRHRRAHRHDRHAADARPRASHRRIAER